VIHRFRGFTWAIFYFILFRAYLFLTRLRFVLLKKVFKDTISIGDLIQPGQLNDSVAIIAGYPIGSLSYKVSLDRLVTGLIDSGSSILCVFNNKPSDEIMRMLSRPSISIYVRKNYGRDFACYQAGIKFLTDTGKISKLTELILVNDTLYWFESSESIMRKLRAHEWSCLYLNLEKHTHAQSFLLRFDHKVVNSTCFSKFWEDYLPLSAKRHLIHRGEIALTTGLLASGFNIFPIVNPELLESADVEVSGKKLNTLSKIPLGGLKPIGAVPVLPTGYSEGTFRNYMFGANIDEASSNPEEFLSKNYLDYLDWLKNFVYSDPPHRIGLHISLLFNFPLKRDMYKFIHLTPIANSVVEIDPGMYESILLDQTNSMTKFMRGDFKNRLKRKMGEH